MTKRFGFRVVPLHPGHAERHEHWPRLHEHHNHWWRVLGGRVGTGNRNFPYNENPKRPLNTTSLKCCLPSTDAIDRREKIHECVWRSKFASRKRTSLISIRFPQKKKITSDTFLTEWYKLVSLEVSEPHVMCGSRSTCWETVYGILSGIAVCLLKTPSDPLEVKETASQHQVVCAILAYAKTMHMGCGLILSQSVEKSCQLQKIPLSIM